MKIVLTADPELPVPPVHYGGIERVVDLLARGLVARGHEVVLFADRNSRSAGRLVPWPGADSRSRVDTVRNAAVLAGEVLRGRFDLVHSFSRVAYLAPLLPLSIPKLMTYQRPVAPRTIRFGTALSRGTLGFTAVSEAMIRPVRSLGRWSVVPNGVPLSTYDFVPRVPDDAPLVFLGRVEAIKGPHLAIEIARRAGRRLVIAGNVPDAHRAWAQAHVFPHVDGAAVAYVGPVDDAQKSALLGSAAAFLMPILWDEPFGIVMAEALACGTPVLGLRRGSVPEVVDDGVTGFVRDGVDGLVGAVARLAEIDRAACRLAAETRYSETVVVDAYEAVYRAAVRHG
ncbi:glycosyltransferase family 4 protein [Prosthecomicrobium pneumaticum]|uniref:Glycosyltransferase involved in cell wall biosynthesis n=1 Tax=Prosthecomicrobium pneumaticum TaxID=81895 RepID=A0A7W9FKY3_9HYPH|nr:glycosyltransferase family 4 protein [Prosthecomicrobium pneumaticum]MBB5751873.1 glycosyltransferase involved in cell wall biosynthesis [Prosthecomicrobium pneumaticum]